MDQLTRKNCLICAIEAVPGVDVNPVAADAIAVRSLNVTPVEVEVLENPIQRPTMGASKKLHAGKHAVLDFEIALAGCGTPGVAPQYARVLRTCGRGESIEADTSASYALVDDDFETMTFYWYMDGSLHKINYAMGSCEFTLDKNNIPIIKASFTGLYQPATSAELPVVDFSAYINPVPVGALTTPVFQLYGIDCRMEKLEIKDGADIKYRNVVGGEYVMQTDRQVSGSVVIESPQITTTNWFEKIVENNESGTLYLKHGTTAGHIIEINAPCVQLSTPKYGDSDGVVTLEMDISFIPVSGNDELTIKYT